jgi:hydrogenase expression/formation protein HypD
MKYIDEYRDPILAKAILADIHRRTTRPWVLMEICGGQTHAIIRNGINQVLPEQIELVHGPGCPVCVTPLETIDRALAIAGRPEVIFCSFGDMLRVPGSTKDLFMVKSEGGDVRMVYSPLDAIKIAKNNPDREVVFLAVGFETTAPGNAMAIHQAAREELKNFSVLASHVLVPPVMRALLASSENRVQGYLAAGHVCSIMGWEEYKPIAREFQVPIVVTGFELIDILAGILAVVKQLEEGRHDVENQYVRVVEQQGNIPAQKMIQSIFEVTSRKWRGIGEIPSSGLKICDSYNYFDAEKRFRVDTTKTQESLLCVSGEILQGLKKPTSCPAFAKECCPEHPLGATMVSSEGACAAYYKYNSRGTY